MAGADIIRSSRPAGSAEAKGAGDYVPDVDRRSEEAITRILIDEAPDIPVLGEEEGGRQGKRYWLVDPLDGTTNFMHGFPVVGVSLALVEDGRPSVGVVSDWEGGDRWLETGNILAGNPAVHEALLEITRVDP